MVTINGKQYPLWSQFVDRRSEWVDGTLEDFGDSFMPCNMCTKIKNITLTPNGEDSAYFSVDGDDFGCGFDVGHGGVCGGDEGWITFSGYGGHKWRIKSNKSIDSDPKNPAE